MMLKKLNLFYEIEAGIPHAHAININEYNSGKKLRDLV
jgi:hypothetical protein